MALQSSRVSQNFSFHTLKGQIPHKAFLFSQLNARVHLFTFQCATGGTYTARLTLLAGVILGQEAMKTVVNMKPSVSSRGRLYAPYDLPRVRLTRTERRFSLNSTCGLDKHICTCATTIVDTPTYTCKIEQQPTCTYIHVSTILYQLATACIHMCISTCTCTSITWIRCTWI